MRADVTGLDPDGIARVGEVVEGEVISSDLVVVRQQPGQSLVAETGDPSAMVAVASRLASALKDIVERQKLYAVISGKKYPQVEAWMTIARLDNVVAREPQPPIRHDDGSYEAFAELIRLSDGMVIGSSSALCGTADDKPWGQRAEPARRSMAQTRATSRAFRQQYSWIMALAGYEPTPAEEMPVDTSGHSSSPAAPPAPAAAPSGGGGSVASEGSWDGTFATTATADAQVRPEKKRGHVLKFVLTDPDPNPGHRRINVRVFGDLAYAVGAALAAHGNPETVTVWGTLTTESFTKDGNAIAYAVCEATRVMTPDWTVPAVDAVSVAPAASDAKVDDLSDLPW